MPKIQPNKIEEHMLTLQKKIVSLEQSRHRFFFMPTEKKSLYLSFVTVLTSLPFYILNLILLVYLCT